MGWTKIAQKILCPTKTEQPKSNFGEENRFNY